MIIVSDTSPIIALLKADSLWILEKMFSKVVIPSGVYEELITNNRFIDESEILKKSDFINIMDVQDQGLVTELRKQLDKGESQAIVLAKELDMNLLIDERKGRRIAVEHNLKIVGTVGILKYAYKNKWLLDDDIRICKEKMINAKIRIAEELFDTIFRWFMHKRKVRGLCPLAFSL